MSVIVNWVDEEPKHVLWQRYFGLWTWADYDAMVDRTIALLDSVDHPVIIIHDPTLGTSVPKTSKTLPKTLNSLRRMQEHPNYGQLTVFITHDYWSTVNFWLVTKVAGDQMKGLRTAKSIQEAAQIALDHLALR